jgi:hypothetical protein
MSNKKLCKYADFAEAEELRRQKRQVSLPTTVHFTSHSPFSVLRSPFVILPEMNPEMTNGEPRTENEVSIPCSGAVFGQRCTSRALVICGEG